MKVKLENLSPEEFEYLRRLHDWNCRRRGSEVEIDDYSAVELLILEDILD